MFIAAIAHKYSFPHQPYHINIPNYGNERTWFSSLAPMWDLTDVQQDLTEHIGVVGSSLSRRFRGRTSYHLTRGTSETDRLVANNPNLASAYQGGYNISNASDSDGSNPNHYGAMSSSDDRLAVHSSDDLAPIHSKYKNEGISIKPSQKTREYSPQYGVPKVLGNYFTQQPRTAQNATQSSASSSRYDQSTRSDNTTSKSDNTTSGFDLSAYDKAANKSAMKKSDSTASDWLSTPTDDFVGIDLKGVEKDYTNFRRDPKI